VTAMVKGNDFDGLREFLAAARAGREACLDPAQRTRRRSTEAEGK
jgi:hypothetical protein